MEDTENFEISTSDLTGLRSASELRVHDLWGGIGCRTLVSAVTTQRSTVELIPPLM